MASLQRKNLSELSFEISNALVVGLIIGKTEPRIFISKKDGAERGVLMFTIRDSVKCFVNCKVWGGRQKIEEYNRTFKIGDVIEIVTPKISSINSGLEGSQYNPKSSLPFTLAVNEGSGFVQMHHDLAIVNELQHLNSAPIGPTNSSLSLADVHSNGQKMSGQHIDLLVVVRARRGVRSIQTRFAESRNCLETIVMDKSFVAGILLTFWHQEWIEKAQFIWEPMNTVLQLIDVRVDFSSFYKSTVLVFSNKTLVITNPQSPEAEALLQYCSSESFAETELYSIHGVNALLSAESVTSVMTVKQVYDRAEGSLGGENEQFSAVLYSIVTKFDLDGVSNVFSRRCNSCKKIIVKSLKYCSSVQCQMNMSLKNSSEPSAPMFNINVHLTDHTGTLVEGRLMNEHAQTALGLTVEGFQHLTATEKCNLKWKFLLERFAAKVVVQTKSATRPLTIIILEMRSVSLREASEKILVY